jgi:prevent-host-death family protein
METINIHAAKTNLSKLIERVEHGEQIVISRNGKPVAQVVPYPAEGDNGITQPRQFGQWAGKVWFAPDYDEADAMIEKMFNESEIFPKD